MLHTLTPFIQFISTPMLAAVDLLAPNIANAAGRPAGQADYMAAAFAASSGLITVICMYWACWAHARLSNLKILVRQLTAKTASALSWHRALIENSLQGVIMMRTATEEREYMGDGRELFDRVIDSAQAAQAIRAIDALTEKGTAFTLTIRTPLGQLVLRGRPVGGRAVVYISEQHLDADNRAYLELLDAMPGPAWALNADGALSWANRAYWISAGAQSLEAALDGNLLPDWTNAEQAASVMESGVPAVSRHDALVFGARRVYATALSQMEGGVLGTAHDITALADEQAAQQAALDTQGDIVDRLDRPVAIFNAARKLVHYNRAYAQMWSLSPAWLDKGPSQDEILDALREKRRLPEQRNFTEWKAALASSEAQDSDDVWHLPGGRSVAVTSRRHLGGGVFIQYEDISQRLHLESALSLMTQVQKATLDTIDEGIAIFGTDGKLILHNAPFAALWRLNEDELASQPHFTEIADLCTTRIGRDGIWGIVACGVNSATPERFGEWGKARRADGRFISLSLSRLPNGATVTTFTDITDLENFTNLDSGASHAAA